jgi:zona occludens toxin (predicted ATPase)
MAQGYSAETVGVLDGTKTPAAKSDGRLMNAKVRTFMATFDLSQTTVKGAQNDTNVCFVIPKGHKVLFGYLLSSVTMGGTATIAVGNGTTAGKYRAAAIHTTADAPQLFMLSAAEQTAPLTADETVLITIAAANLPGTGILQVVLFAAAR